MKKPQKIKTIHDKRRFGHHQKRSKVFSNTYLPYLPMTVILFLSVFVSGYSPKQSTLAYATSLSQQDLLVKTNNERSKADKRPLKINKLLSDAAQSKANDMTRRNYWSHNTPDGQEPWVFINGAGYSYLKAGENLAYGFANSGDTIQGWMNSPKHRDNLLDADFTEVGFGYADSNNYNKAGQETVVVAMYGKPYALAPNTQKTVVTGPTNEKPLTNSNKPQVLVASAKPVSRLQAITGGSMPWLLSGVTFLTGFLIAILLLRHGIRLRKLLKDSRNFITHHPFIDSTILALIILGITLLRTVGYIL